MVAERQPRAARAREELVGAARAVSPDGVFLWGRHAALLHGILENDVDKWQKDFLDALRSDNRGAEEIRSAMQTLTLERPGTGRSRVISGAALQGRA